MPALMADEIRGLEYPPPSIAGGATKWGTPTDVPTLSDAILARIRDVVAVEREKNPIDPAVAVQMVFASR